MMTSQEPPSPPISSRMDVSGKELRLALGSTMKVMRTRKTPRKERRGGRVKKIPWELCQPYWITDKLVIEYSEELFELFKTSDEDNDYVLGDILEELD